MKILKIGLVNLAVLSGMLASIELSLNIAKYIKHGVLSSLSVNSDAIQTGKLIPTKWEQVFHPGVGHSHQESEFNKNANTSKLSYDNLSVTEVFQQQDSFNSEFNILVLGGSTTDPLGTHLSGYRGTWVHHLFEGIAQSNPSRYVVDNAGNGGSTSSNELLRLITKLHSNNYDLTISFNGINEIYFADNPYFRDKENILASSMLLQAMGDFRIIKGLDGQTYLAGNPLLTLLKNSRTHLHLLNIKKKLSAAKSQQFYSLSKDDKDMLTYGANIWAKNIEFMNSVSLATNAKYLVVLQPTLGLGNDYCTIQDKECMLSNSRYIAQINYLYSILRKHCNAKDYCLDISRDHDLTSNDSLYTSPRHPNSKGNKRIADLIRGKIIQTLSN